jgi:histidinol-phosphate aminotransferase
MTPEVRSDLTTLSGYHSAQVEVDVRLNTNESPFTLPSGFTDDLISRVSDAHLNRYPDREATTLRSGIAEVHGVALEEVFAANGSNEVIQSLLLAFGGPGRTALVFEPTYALHSHIAHITGTTVVAGERGDDFVLRADHVRSVAEEVDPDVLFLCSPNNPTGGTDSPELVLAALSSTTGLVVVDEAYGQFADTSALDLREAPGADRLVVTRTFSKTWALAGVRLGYLVAAPEVVSGCFSVALPYHLSSLTQAAGECALGYGPAMDAQVAELVRQREALWAQMAELDLELWPSRSNFILFRPSSKGGHDVWQDLVERSVLVRDCSSWDRLEDCLRVTVGTAEENARFLEALKEAL